MYLNRFAAFCCMALVFSLVSAAMAKDAGFAPDGCIVAFPFSVDAAVTAPSADAHAAELTKMVTEGISSVNRIAVVSFNERLVGVQRAVREQEGNAQSAVNIVLKSPSSNLASRVAGSMGAGLALVGSLDSYVYRATSGEVEVGVTVEVVDTATGAVRKAVSVSGFGRGGVQSSPEIEKALANQAIRDAANQAVVEIVAAAINERAAETQQAAPVVKSGKRGNNNLIPTILWGIITGGMIGG